MGKQNHGLPTIGSAPPAVQPVVTSTPQPTEEEMGQTLTLAMPFFPWDTGYCRYNLDVRLTNKQAMTLKGILLGLEKQEAQLENGRCVSNPVDAIRWMLENVK